MLPRDYSTSLNPPEAPPEYGKLVLEESDIHALLSNNPHRRAGGAGRHSLETTSLRPGNRPDGANPCPGSSRCGSLRRCRDRRTQLDRRQESISVTAHTCSPRRKSPKPKLVSAKPCDSIRMTPTCSTTWARPSGNRDAHPRRWPITSALTSSNPMTSGS